MERSDSQGAFIQPQAISQQLAHIQQNGLVVVISDFYQQQQEISQLVCQLVNRRTNVLALQMTSNAELDFPFDGTIRFQHPELPQQLLVSAAQAKEHYLKHRAEYFKQLTETFKKHQVDCFSANINQPLHEVIHSLLLARKKAH